MRASAVAASLASIAELASPDPLLWELEQRALDQAAPGDHVEWGVSGEKLSVAVVEQHGDVVRFWLEALGHLPQHLWEEVYCPSFATTSLLHVDSHSDMMLATWGDVREAMRNHESDVERLRMELLRAPAIGDFVSSALFAGLVSDVLWLRSDFAKGKYNGPPPGVYEVGVGTDSETLGENLSVDDEVLCLTTLLRRFEPADESYVNHDPETLDSCASGEPHHARTVNVSVATLDQLLDRSSSFPRPWLAHGSWILDVDLDFFASFDPTVAYFVGFGFSEELVTEHLQGSLICDDEVQIHHVVDLFRHAGEDFSPEGAKSRLVGRQSSCRVVADRLEGLRREIDEFDDQRQVAWRELWSFRRIEDWVGSSDFMTTLFLADPHMGPSQVPSEQEVAIQLGRFESLLAEVVRERGEPRLVTVSRSMRYDHYLPPERLRQTEDGLLELLKRLFASRELDVVFSFDKADTS